MLAACLALIDEPTDREKFEDLYYTYRDYMFNIAMSVLHNESLAEETVQDCFLKIAKNFNGVTTVESKKTKAMVSIIVKNKAIDNLDKEHYNKVEYIQEEDNIISDELISDISSKIGYDRIIQEIKNLDDIYNDILFLKFVYGSTAQEISDILHIPVRTVETRIYRGRKILQERLEGLCSD